jgi:hypothetical protein
MEQAKKPRKIPTLNPPKMEKIRPLAMKPKGKKDEQGRYGFSKGGAANLVAQAMEVQKPN